MSTVNAVDPIEAVTTAARDWLKANRPAALPENITVNDKTVPVSIVALVTDKVAATRPVVLFDAAISGQPHPNAYTMRLRVRLLVQTDETEGATSSEWLAEGMNALRDGFEGLKAELKPKGYWMTRWRPRGGGLESQGERGHERFREVEVSLRDVKL